jgi:hypothetical protein
LGIVFGAAELIPPALVIARYYRKDQAASDALEAEVAALEQELAEEHGGEDGLLADAKNDKEKLTKASAAARLKDLRPGNAKPQLGAKQKKAAELGLSAPSEDAEETLTGLSPSSATSNRPPCRNSSPEGRACFECRFALTPSFIKP